MKRTWPIIGVADVTRSFKWYQSLFGQAETLPGHDYFGQILDTDGTVLLCLHQWAHTSIHRWPAPTTRNLAMDCSCSSALMILTRRFPEHAPLWRGLKRSPSSIQVLVPESLPFVILTGITS